MLQECPDDATITSAFPILKEALNDTTSPFINSLVEDETKLKDFLTSSCESGTIEPAAIEEDFIILFELLRDLDEEAPAVATCRDNQQAVEGYMECAFY